MIYWFLKGTSSYTNWKKQKPWPKYYNSTNQINWRPNMDPETANKATQDLQFSFILQLTIPTKLAESYHGQG